ncbi:hypothetical protein EDF56_105188 [Novosphingobium sp. PhB165]|uniref:XRE family transcriptional regulator n=1 Tax=Novosphingobium sp. PhB165 TaxID=2485105 RepID=UPI0010520371|nr:XRE family transcriptional regulator [Novosphingobium sp. PhB165]TCM17844.1 hypothetical protein EDF56_105188 [Novosphingobium sp. PhB165]
MTASRSGPPTSDEYRKAVSAIIRGIQKGQGLNDRQLADQLGCSPGTIRNAKSEATSLDPILLLAIERGFGPGAIDRCLALAQVRAVALPERVIGVDPILALVEALHRLVEAQAVDSDGGKRITRAELGKILPELRQGRASLDALIARADDGRS